MSQFMLLLDAAVAELRRNVAAAEAAASILVGQLVAARRVAVYGVGREGLAMKGFAMRLHHMGLQVSVVGEMTAARVGAGDLLLLSAGPGYFATAAALSQEARRDGASVVVLTSQPPEAVHQRLGSAMVLRLPATCLPPAEPAGAPTSPRGHPAAVGAPAVGVPMAAAAAGPFGGGHPTAVPMAVGPGGMHQQLRPMMAQAALAVPTASPTQLPLVPRPAAAAPVAHVGPPSPLLMGSSYELALQLFFDLVCMLLQQRLGLQPADLAARHTNLE